MFLLHYYYFKYVFTVYINAMILLYDVECGYPFICVINQLQVLHCLNVLIVNYNIHCISLTKAVVDHNFQNVFLGPKVGTAVICEEAKIHS